MCQSSICAILLLFLSFRCQNQSLERWWHGSLASIDWKQRPRLSTSIKFNDSIAMHGIQIVNGDERIVLSLLNCTGIAVSPTCHKQFNTPWSCRLLRYSVSPCEQMHGPWNVASCRPLAATLLQTCSFSFVFFVHVKHKLQEVCLCTQCQPRRASPWAAK